MRSRTFVALIGFCLATHGSNAQSLSIGGIPYALEWEGHPVHFDTDSDRLVIEAGHWTDLYRDPSGHHNQDNAPRLMCPVDSDFTLSAAIQPDFIGQWSSGGILLEGDSTHWIKFCFEKDYTGANRVVSVSTKELSDDCNSMALEMGKAYFTIAKTGDVVQLYCSTDDRHWYLIRRVNLGFRGPMKAGFIVQAPNPRGCRVVFSRIRYTRRRVTDPFQPGSF
jgi:regulation of enolase protein 1 (concanavalin A-like superfamily)